jgi:hypothetical protein
MDDVEASRRLAEAAAGVIGIIQDTIVEPALAVERSLGRIGELQLDATAEVELLAELGDLRKSLSHRLRDDMRSLHRLGKSMSAFEQRIRQRKI